MVTAKQVIKSIKQKPIGKVIATPLGQIGYDNPRDDIEKVKKVRTIITETIGIGTSNPYYPAHLKSSGTASFLIQTMATNGTAQFMLQNDSQMWTTRVYSDDSFKIRDETGTKDVLTISTGGVIEVLQDQTSADTSYVANILFGTDATPPTASTTTKGSIYIQYTA